ncbi:hypothetical protein GCM10009665_13670 [Kitasatospora nipponensis]|uniref:Regulator of septum formation n=1 Tax=Kitasatospora nipponensis TaxID=258049 RepID=A0ABN1VYZ7_9ACTN
MTPPLTQPPTPPARPGRRLLPLVAVLALLGVGALLLALLWPAAKKPVAAPAPPPSPSASPSPSPSPSPSKVVPYPYFAIGTCVSVPQLTPGLPQAQAGDCGQSHDGQAIGNPVLPDGLTKESQIGQALLTACRPFVDDWRTRQGDGTWFAFPVGPSLVFYDQGWRDATCLLTAAQRPGGQKLTAPLKN